MQLKISLTWLLFRQFPFLNKTGEDIDEVFENWKKYKYSVPVYGAILLNQSLDKVNINEVQIHYRRYYHSVLMYFFVWEISVLQNLMKLWKNENIDFKEKRKCKKKK